MGATGAAAISIAAPFTAGGIGSHTTTRKITIGTMTKFARTPRTISGTRRATRKTSSSEVPNPTPIMRHTTAGMMT